MQVDFRTFDVSQIKFAKLARKGKQAYSFAYVTQSGGSRERIALTTPICNITRAGATDIAVDVLGVTNELRAFFDKLDKHIVSTFSENLEVYFGARAVDPEALASSYVGSVNEEGSVQMSLSRDGLEIRDQFHKEVPLTKFYKAEYAEGRVLFNIEGVGFTSDGKIKPLFVVPQIQLVMLYTPADWAFGAESDDGFTFKPAAKASRQISEEPEPALTPPSSPTLPAPPEETPDEAHINPESS